MRRTPIYISAICIAALIIAYIVSYGMSKAPEGESGANAIAATTSEENRRQAAATPAAETATSTAEKPNFNKAGNIVEGKGKGSWEIVYEEPGKPALRAELDFATTSVCDLEGIVPCESAKWTIGDRVRVEGILTGGAITVTRIRKI